MRILDRGNITIGIRDLGSARRTSSASSRSSNGPTASSCHRSHRLGQDDHPVRRAHELNRPDRKIITAEDPVEYYLPGVNQVEVKHSIGLDFARIIRAMLRQAPNIILVAKSATKRRRKSLCKQV